MQIFRISRLWGICVQKYGKFWMPWEQIEESYEPGNHPSCNPSPHWVRGNFHPFHHERNLQTAPMACATLGLFQEDNHRFSVNTD